LVECERQRVYRDHHAVLAQSVGDDFDTRRSFLASLLNRREGSLVECERQRVYRDHHVVSTQSVGDDFDTRRSFLASLLNRREGSLVECERQRVYRDHCVVSTQSVGDDFDTRRSFLASLLNRRELFRWSSASASECVETITWSRRWCWVMISIRVLLRRALLNQREVFVGGV